MKTVVYPFVLIIVLAFSFQVNLTGQIQILFNGNLDVEFSKGGSDSHYFINGIHKEFKNWRFAPLQANLGMQLVFSDHWTLNARMVMERDEGTKFNLFRMAQINLQWQPEKSTVQWSLGRFVTPFGLFNQKQLSTNRNFIDVPLAYGYYNNISDILGFAEGLGDINSVKLEDRAHWGLPMSYFNGYSNGLKAKWVIKPYKVILETALTTAAPISQNNLNFQSLNFALLSRLELQPAYFWKQGISISYGSFFQKKEINASLLEPLDYQQLMIGLDFKSGAGFFEISGELLAAWYKVPEYLPLTSVFKTDENGIPVSQTLNNWSAYLDIKYEFPFLIGAYVAYRFDSLNFGQWNKDGTGDTNWDNNVIRNTLALGFRIREALLLRTAFSIQNVKSKDWDIYTWRSTATIYF